MKRRKFELKLTQLTDVNIDDGSPRGNFPLNKLKKKCFSASDKSETRVPEMGSGEEGIRVSERGSSVIGVRVSE